MKEVNKNQNTPKRAIMYARTSKVCSCTSDKSIQERLEKQINKIQEYAIKNNIEIVDHFYDVAKSARDDNRPGLQQMMHCAEIHIGDINYILVYDIRRLSSNSQSFCMDILGKLQPLGISIRSATENIDESPTGQFNQMMSVALAQIKAEKIY